jgi:hypothetical protein
MALDGPTLEVADTPSNARAFGRPGSGRGAAALPPLRAVALIETGTHVLGDKVNLVLMPTELFSDGSFLARIDPSPTARRQDRDGITVRVIEYALDTPAGSGGRSRPPWTKSRSINGHTPARCAVSIHARWSRKSMACCWRT